MFLISKFQFRLSVYSDDEESDTPSHFFIELTTEQAAYFLRRIALLENIHKVDSSIDRMIYKSPTSGLYFFSTDENGNPVLDSECTSIENNEVHVDRDGIWWTSYCGSSGNELNTQRIEQFMLVNLSRGLDPMKVAGMENPLLDQFQNFQNTLVGHLPQNVAIPTNLPTVPPMPHTLVPPIEVTFDTTDYDTPDPDPEPMEE